MIAWSVAVFVIAQSVAVLVILIAQSVAVFVILIAQSVAGFVILIACLLQAGTVAPSTNIINIQTTSLAIVGVPSCPKPCVECLYMFAFQQYWSVLALGSVSEILVSPGFGYCVRNTGQSWVWAFFLYCVKYWSVLAVDFHLVLCQKYWSVFLHCVRNTGKSSYIVSEILVSLLALCQKYW